MVEAPFITFRAGVCCTGYHLWACDHEFSQVLRSSQEWIRPFLLDSLISWWRIRRRRASFYGNAHFVNVNHLPPGASINISAVRPKKVACLGLPLKLDQIDRSIRLLRCDEWNRRALVYARADWNPSAQNEVGGQVLGRPFWSLVESIETVGPFTWRLERGSQILLECHGRPRPIHIQSNSRRWRSTKRNNKKRRVCWVWSMCRPQPDFSKAILEQPLPTGIQFKSETTCRIHNTDAVHSLVIRPALSDRTSFIPDTTISWESDSTRNQPREIDVSASTAGTPPPEIRLRQNDATTCLALALFSRVRPRNVRMALTEEKKRSFESPSRFLARNALRGRVGQSETALPCPPLFPASPCAVALTSSARAGIIGTGSLIIYTSATLTFTRDAVPRMYQKS